MFVNFVDKKKMIEIVWLDEYEAMMCASRLLAWLAATLAQNEEYHNIEFNGYMIVKEEGKEKGKTGCSVLIICGDPVSQNRLLKILQQPPEEYEHKYIARIPCNEPEPVHEQAKEDADQYDIEIGEET